MKKLLTTLTLTGLILGLSACRESQAETAKEPTKQQKPEVEFPADVEKIEIAITGMSCEMMCVPKVESALADFEGIDHLSVKVGKVIYAGSAEAQKVIARIEEKTPFKAGGE